MMEMSISRPRRDLLPGTSANAVMAGTSDLRDVTYSFFRPGSTPSGLVRTEGDRMAVEVVEAGGGTAPQISGMQVLAPEVVALSFRYLDGQTWLEMWDSETNGRIPRAIEVQFAFPPPRQKPSLFNTAVSRSTDSFRAVILIPVSDPFPKEFLQ